VTNLASGQTERLTNYLADPAELKILHMVGPGRRSRGQIRLSPLAVNRAARHVTLG
jgi:hypothetical protein